jgi:predicted O-methyltransferase YrrM
MPSNYVYEIPSLLSKSDIESISYLASQTPNNSNILEIGSFLGSSTCTIKEANPHSTLYCVDIWNGETFDKYLKGNHQRDFVYEEVRSEKFKWYQNTNHLLNVYAYQMSSYEADFDIKFDMIFIDGDHRYDSIKFDLAKWHKYLKPGGIMCGHDYGFPSTTKAILEHCLSKNVALYTLKDSIWYLKEYNKEPE